MSLPENMVPRIRYVVVRCLGAQEKLMLGDQGGLLIPARLQRADKLVQMPATIEQDAHISCGSKTLDAGPKQIVMLQLMGLLVPSQGSASVPQVHNLTRVVTRFV